MVHLKGVFPLIKFEIKPQCRKNLFIYSRKNIYGSVITLRFFNWGFCDDFLLSLAQKYWQLL